MQRTTKQVVYPFDAGKRHQKSFFLDAYTAAPTEQEANQSTSSGGSMALVPSRFRLVSRSVSKLISYSM